MTDDMSQWLSSHELAAQLRLHRNNDVRVTVNGVGVPVANARYDMDSDTVVIELYVGDDLRVALWTNDPPAPEES